MGNELNKILNNVYPAKDQNELNDRKELNKIFSIEQIQSKSFYGFREENQQFLRIYFLNPKSVKLTFKAIKQGKLFDRKANIYEAHITYLMQFFVNYKLSGMNFINLINYNERTSRDRRTLSKDKLYFVKQEKQTICKLEIDAQISNIVVTKSENRFINPGLVLIWQEEKRRLIGSNKDIKGIFKSNLKDCGNRKYEKKSIELNYLEQLKDYFNFRDNFQIFNQTLNHSLIRDNQSFSQSILERIIQNEKEMVSEDQFKQLQSQQSKLLKLKDVRSQNFSYLVKNLKKHTNREGWQVILDNVEEKEDDENGSDESESEDELDVNNQTKFASLMLLTQKSMLNSQTLDQKIKKEKLSQNSSYESSLILDPEKFNLNNESLIATSKDASLNNSEPNSQVDDESESSNLNSHISSRTNQLKRSCCSDDDDELDRGFLINKLTDLNEIPLFSDDSSNDTFRNEDEGTLTPFSIPSQLSQKSQSTLTDHQSQQSLFSDINPLSNETQQDSQSIFSFYLLNSIESKSQSSQSQSTCETVNDKKDTNTQPDKLQPDALIDNNTSTPLILDSNQSDDCKQDKLRIRKCLGTKFMKLSKNNDRSATASPSTRSSDKEPLPYQQSKQQSVCYIQTPNSSFNKSTQSNKSIQSTQNSKYTESSFTMNEKIQHLSESDIDCGSPISNLSHEHQNLTVLTMELFATTDHELKPNPLNDSIKMIFYMIYNDHHDDLLDNRSLKKHFIGIIIQESKIDILGDLDQTKSQLSSTSSNLTMNFNQTTHTKCKSKSINNLLYFKNDEEIKVDYVDNELTLIEKFIEVMVEHDAGLFNDFVL